MTEESKMSKKFEHSIELGGGHAAPDPKTKKPVVHTQIVFGKRLTTRDLIDLDNNPQAQNPTQYNDLIRRRMITKFGALKMPVPLNVLLSLDALDRADLAAAADKFMAASRGDRQSEMRENGDVKLLFGFDLDGTIYDVAQFGALTTGRDEVEADALGSGVARQCFLIGRQITRIATSDGAAAIDGAVEVEKFYALDAEDFNLLRIGAALWQTSFRLKRESVSGQRNGDGRVSAGAGDAHVGDGSAESADDAD